MKHSRFEREQRAAEDRRMREVADAWYGRVAPDEMASFRAAVAVAHARPVAEPRPNMAPGTLPNPPRPGREPRVVDDRSRTRR
jgi:hypothetical protein